MRSILEQELRLGFKANVRGWRYASARAFDHSTTTPPNRKLSQLLACSWGIFLTTALRFLFYFTNIRLVVFSASLSNVMTPGSVHTLASQILTPQSSAP
jgi:hypothetical protein